MVVLARTIGLPARLITGYATGVYDPINAQYIVTEANAHSWVEIYFGGIGWVEFEPTGGLPAIQRNTQASNEIEIPQIKQAGKTNVFRWLQIDNLDSLALLGGMICILLLVIIIWIVKNRWYLLHLSSSMTIIHLYNQFYRYTQPLTEQFHTGDTPYEYEFRLKQRLKMIGARHRWNPYFQRGAEETARLTNLYTQVVFSPHPPMLDDKATAINIWFHLRIRLWIAKKLVIITRTLARLNTNLKKVKYHVRF
jgi:hypothetical protein